MASGIDPVCGMKVGESAPAKSQFQGEEYSFCSEACRLKFEQNPERYADQQGERDRSAGGGSTT